MSLNWAAMLSTQAPVVQNNTSEENKQGVPRELAPRALSQRPLHEANESSYPMVVGEGERERERIERGNLSMG